MTMVDGYYNGSSYISLEKVDVKPNQRVRILVLDEYIDSSATFSQDFCNELSTLCGCGAGLWQMDAQEYVNTMRKDRAI